MLKRHFILPICGFLALAPAAVGAQVSQPAGVRMNQLGPENQAIAQLVGTWDVTEAVWDTPDTPSNSPTATMAMVAVRRMVGSMLEETLYTAADTHRAAVQRVDYLSFNRVEGRWEYVSMDTRAPVGIMSASSLTRDDGGTIVLTFQPFAIAGAGPDVTGQMLRMDQVISRQGPDQDTKEQHFILADGVGTRWLAHRYSYVRRSS